MKDLRFKLLFRHDRAADRAIFAHRAEAEVVPAAAKWRLESEAPHALRIRRRKGGRDKGPHRERAEVERLRDLAVSF